MRNLLLLTLSALGLISISSFHLPTTITRPQIRINAESESYKIKIKTKFALVASVFGSVLSLPLPAFASASASTSASPPFPPPPQSLSRFLQKTYKKHATTLSPGLDKIYSLPTFTVVTPWSTPFTNPDRNSNSNSEGGRAGGAVLHFLDLSDAESSRSEFHQQEGLQGINGNIQITRLGKAMRNVLAKGVPSGQKGDGGNKIEQMVYKIVGSSLGRQQAAKVLKAQGRGAKVPDIPIFYVGGVTLKGGKIPMFMRLDQAEKAWEGAVRAGKIGIGEEFEVEVFEFLDVVASIDRVKEEEDVGGRSDLEDVVFVPIEKGVQFRDATIGKGGGKSRLKGM